MMMRRLEIDRVTRKADNVFLDVEADKRFVDRLKLGAIDEVLQSFTEYSKKTVAEMGGRALTTMLGVVTAMSREGKPMAATQYGDYAQSSGSCNAVLLIADRDTLAKMPPGLEATDALETEDS